MTDSQPLTGDEPHTRECLDRYKANLPCNCRAPQPLTGDELAAITARANAQTAGAIGYFPDRFEPEEVLRLVAEIERLQAGREMEQRALANALPLVAEVERLRAQVDALVELAATADRPSSDDEWWMGRADALDDVRRILGKP
jgi:hypothetical protein